MIKINNKVLQKAQINGKEVQKIVINGNTVYQSEPAIELTSIAFTSFSQINYYQNDSFTTPGVTATYSDGSTRDVSAEATYTLPDMSVVGSFPVRATYTENGITKTVSKTIYIYMKNL